MKVKVFGVLKTLIPGNGDWEVSLPSGARVEDLIEGLQKKYPPVADLLRRKKVLVSVNQEIAEWDTVLKEEDEVALLPPFAGG